MRAIGISDIGKCRKNNEDAYFVGTSEHEETRNLFVIADGMGGCNAGEVASSYAIETLIKHVSENRKNHSSDDILDLLAGALVEANKKVYEKSNSGIEFAEMGTTLVAAMLENKKIHIAYAGDSRAYLIRQKEMTQMTMDHSYVMELVKLGSITREEAKTHPKRNVITRAIGIRESVEIDTVVQKVEKGDYYLLCTDGLSGMLNDEEILGIISKRIAFDKKAQRLIDTANKKGGHDNISLILIDIGGKE